MSKNKNEIETGNDSSLKRTRGIRLGSLSSIRTFDSLKSGPFRFYLLGMLGMWSSMNMQQVIQSLLVYRITGSAAILGVLSLGSAIPTLLFSLWGGALADRFRKKLIVQIGQGISAVVAFSVAITLSTGFLGPEHPGSWWVLLVNSILQGTINALMMPARQSIIPEIINKERVMNAVAINTVVMNSLRLIAPAGAGFLVDALNFQAVYYTMTGLYLASVLFTSFIPTSNSVSGREKRNQMSDIKDGLKYIWGNPTIFLVILSILLIVILSMPYQTMMPIFTDNILNVGATGLGIMMSLSGVGALIGSLIVASLPNNRRGALMLSASLITGLGLVFFAFSRSYALSLVLMVFIGLGQAARQTLGTTLLQTYTDSQYLGRVMSINMMDMGLSQLGTFFAGIIAESISAPWAIGGMAAILVIGTLFSFVFVPRLRKLD